MAPLTDALHTLATRERSAALEIKSQWSNPSDILSLLLLIGGDVVQRALAQQAGGSSYLPPPVVFSFGWVAYTFCGLLTVMGNRLLPSPETAAVVLSMQSGYHRSNQSWIISRLLRDYEKLWMPSEVKTRLDEVLKAAGPDRTKAGLCISVFEASADAVAGVPTRDVIWYSGYAVAALQLLISVVPWRMSGIWEIFAITASGTAMAFFTASLPRWTEERWSCGRNTKKTFVLTGGNGAQHAIVIMGAGRGLDLESLAMPCERLSVSRGTKQVYGLLTVLWCALLITVGGLQEQTWFLVIIGAIGMVHTVFVAGAPRRPETFGVHLQYQSVIAETKVMKTLQAAELSYLGLGRCMLTTFFPGNLRDEEEEWWKQARARERAGKEKKLALVRDGASSTSTSSTQLTKGDGEQQLHWDEDEMRCCASGSNFDDKRDDVLRGRLYTAEPKRKCKTEKADTTDLERASSNAVDEQGDQERDNADDIGEDNVDKVYDGV